MSPNEVTSFSEALCSRRRQTQFQ